MSKENVTEQRPFRIEFDRKSNSTHIPLRRRIHLHKSKNIFFINKQNQ